MSGSTTYTTGQLQSAAIQYANQYGVPTQLFLDQIAAENNWSVTGTSSTGAVGIAQILPSTASNPGYGLGPVDPTNPLAALQFAAQYDATLYNQTGSWTGALQAYTQGINNVLLGTATTPYQGSTAVQNDLANLNGGASVINPIGITTSNGYSPVTVQNPVTGSDYYSTPNYANTATMSNPTTTNQTAPSSIADTLSNIWNSIGGKVSSVGIFVIGSILIAGALYLFGRGKR